jgi:hypothetical protein
MPHPKGFTLQSRDSWLGFGRGGAEYKLRSYMSFQQDCWRADGGFCRRACKESFGRVMRSRAEKKSQPKSSYMVILDLAALALIVLVARREDGLAIAISGLIIALIWLVCRWLRTDKPNPLPVKPKVLPKKSTEPQMPAPPTHLLMVAEKSTSWLREDRK